MMKRKRKKLTYQRSIIVGFGALYITCMLLSTYLVKENYEESYNKEVGDVINSIVSDIQNSSFERFDEEGNLNENYINEVKAALYGHFGDDEKYNQMSAALYGPGGTVIAQTEESFCTNFLYVSNEAKTRFMPDALAVYSPYDYFTEEEMDAILEYVDKDYEADKKEEGVQDQYYASLIYDQNTGEPVLLEIRQEKVNHETKVNVYGMEMEYYESLEESEVVWEWVNQEIEDVKSLATDHSRVDRLDARVQNVFSFPYISNGREYYDAWKNNEELQTFDIAKANYAGKYYGFSKYEGKGITYSVINPIQLTSDFIKVGEAFEYALQVNWVSYPWHAAVDYMKYVYLYGFLLMIVCMIKTIHTTNKAYRKLEELEQTRRDFTNAVAHELKTPLAIVRGLAENMDKEKSEEKNALYRREIVRQTEIMDELVKEMIFISKMDSNQIQLKEERVSARELIDNQMKKIEPLINEKNLNIRYQYEDDFVIKGDISVLGKAVFNILENAASYNKPNGDIFIRIDKNGIIIENTSDPIPSEELPHVCEIFYTGNKSRCSDSKHKGLGLYLVKRILDMHGLKFIIENTVDGVKVEIDYYD